MQTMIDWYVYVLTNYAQFEGRASRAEFWYFALASMLINLGLRAFEYVALGSHLLVILYGFALVVPNIAVATRRLHDSDRSGWWQLLALVPVIGWIVLIVFLALEGQPNENRFGAIPKATPH
jgi:uncharacterized membrane protein YhaH (DUF805 family)